MKKLFLSFAVIATMGLVSCGGAKTEEAAAEVPVEEATEVEEGVVEEAPAEEATEEATAATEEAPAEEAAAPAEEAK